MGASIVLADDEYALAKSLAAVLEKAGYVVRTAANGRLALSLVKASEPDLVLLDVMMPGKNGYEVCKELRAAGFRKPILFLTALRSEKDELRALSCGGNSFISKDVSDEILLARIAATLRLSDPGDDGKSFTFAAWTVDPQALTMQRLRSPHCKAESLTEREVAFLRILVDNPNTVLTRDYLLTRLWSDEEATENALTVLVSVLRRKLQSASNRIISVRGVGYSYEA